MLSMFGAGVTMVYFYPNVTGHPGRKLTGNQASLLLLLPVTSHTNNFLHEEPDNVKKITKHTMTFTQ